MVNVNEGDVVFQVNTGSTTEDVTAPKTGEVEYAVGCRPIGLSW